MANLLKIVFVTLFLRFVGSSPKLVSVLTAQSLEPASPSLCLPKVKKQISTRHLKILICLCMHCYKLIKLYVLNTSIFYINYISIKLFLFLMKHLPQLHSSLKKTRWLLYFSRKLLWRILDIFQFGLGNPSPKDNLHLVICSSANYHK